MNLAGKLVGQVEIKSGGDVFHEIFTSRPHHVSGMSPGKVQNCNLHDGQFGTVGSIISWNYTHDGKEKVAKEIIEAVDEKNKSITFKVIEGELMELYQTFIVTLHVDTKGETNLIAWTIEFEKLNMNVPDPNPELDFLLGLSKDIETHHLK